MSAHYSARILPMQTAGTHHLIERTYRESGQYQWVRETVVNALEAGATRIEFGIEWQAVESMGVYRRTIADNGCGMTAPQLVEFFNTFGGGGKPIGGAHENFGVGSKTSLLPWNHYGMVVISWVDGDASMIWVARNPETGEYGLKLEKCKGPLDELTLESVYDPYDDIEARGCDWASVKPDWIEDHGTVVVLLGNGPQTNTVEGDPGRAESDIKGISSFLNRRLWEIPKGVEIFVDELRTTDKSLWPPTQEVAHNSRPNAARDRRTNLRRIEGARHFIEYKDTKFAHGKLSSSGTVELRDGTEVDWFLWNGDRPKVHSYAAISGYIASLYKNELYDIATHHSTYRSFGVIESSVRSKLWLVIRPLELTDGKRGVYPRTDRNALLIKGGPEAGGPLPINEWAAEFADNMPPEILAAIRAARKGSSGTIEDAEWRDRLAERFGARWRMPRLRVKSGGQMRLDLEPTRKSKRVASSESSGGSGSSVISRPKIPPRTGKNGSAEAGVSGYTSGGVPRFRAVSGDELDEGMLAAWQPKDPEYPEGVVLINVDHPVLRSVIEHWQSQYADHHSEEIEADIIDVYGQVAVSKVAHSEHLKGILPSQVVERELRSDVSLTMSLLGLMSEDHLISTRVGGKYHKKRRALAGTKRHVQRQPR